jgi:prolipoprotein diacylglyceryltransferase
MGKPTDVPWASVYEGVPRHASRLAPAGMFLMGYCVVRFGIEFVRLPDANRGYLLHKKSAFF